MTRLKVQVHHVDLEKHICEKAKNSKLPREIFSFLSQSKPRKKKY